jgi:hypothetical protein
MARVVGEQDFHLARNLIPECAKGFIFMGTPHQGSGLTVVGKMLSLLSFWDDSSTNLLEVVEPGSKQNEDLHDEFLRQHKTKQIVNFYEVRPEQIGPFRIMKVRVHLGETRIPSPRNR